MNQQFTQDLVKLGDFLQNEGDLGIVIGSHQNLDTVASALSLYLTLFQSGKNIQIVSLKEPTVEISDLVGVDKIKSSFSGGNSKLVVSLPYTKGEVEKVLFTEQPNTINFHLTAAPGKTITSFDAKQVKLNWEGSAPKVIIAVGVGNIDELDGVVDVANSKIVNIDNYSNNSRFGDIVLVDDMFSSISEMVGKIIKDQRMPLDRDIAQNILDGILFATRNFTKGNTSPAAFEMASYVMYQGAQRKPENPKGQSNRPQPQRSNDQPKMRQNRPSESQNRPSRSQRKSFDATQRPGQDIPFGSSAFNPYQDKDQFGEKTPFQAKRGRADQGQRGDQRVQPTDFPAMHISDIREKIANDNRSQKQNRFQYSLVRVQISLLIFFSSIPVCAVYFANLLVFDLADSSLLLLIQNQSYHQHCL